LKRGEQIIVSHKIGAIRNPPSPPKLKTVSPVSPPAPAPNAGLDLSSSSGAISNAAIQTTEPDSVGTEGGFLVHRIVPDDNSCLFSSIALVFEQDINKTPQMRQSMPSFQENW